MCFTSMPTLVSQRLVTRSNFFIRSKRGGWVSVFTNKSLVICLADSSTLYGNNVHYRRCTFKRNIETRSRNHCCRGKAVSRPVTYSESTSVALVSKHAMRERRYIVTYGLSGSTTFSQIIS